MNCRLRRAVHSELSTATGHCTADDQSRFVDHSARGLLCSTTRQHVVHANESGGSRKGIWCSGNEGLLSASVQHDGELAIRRDYSGCLVSYSVIFFFFFNLRHNFFAGSSALHQ